MKRPKNCIQDGIAHNNVKSCNDCQFCRVVGTQVQGGLFGKKVKEVKVCEQGYWED